MKTNGQDIAGEHVVARVAAMAHQAVDKAAGAATPTADWLTERGEFLNVRQKKLAADACSYVAAHPLKAVGMAVVVGALLGRMFL
jgi:ElaB/YqjD/DUF883 family membrane-anchored ribosome-binding protein